MRDRSGWHLEEERGVRRVEAMKTVNTLRVEHCGSLAWVHPAAKRGLSCFSHPGCSIKEAPDTWAALTGPTCTGAVVPGRPYLYWHGSAWQALPVLVPQQMRLVAELPQPHKHGSQQALQRSLGPGHQQRCGSRPKGPTEGPGTRLGRARDRCWSRDDGRELAGISSRNKVAVTQREGQQDCGCGAPGRRAR